MPTYESQLNGDLNWALMEGSMHFDGTNAVHRTLRRLFLEIYLGQDFACEIISEVRDSYLTLWKDCQQALKDDY